MCVYTCVTLQCIAENLPHPLSVFGIKNGTRLKTDDFLQNYQLCLTIIHRLEMVDTHTLPTHAHTHAHNLVAGYIILVL